MISLQNKNGLYFLFYEVGGHKETIKFENLKHYQQTIHSPSIHNTKQHLLPKMAQVEKDRTWTPRLRNAEDWERGQSRA